MDLVAHGRELLPRRLRQAGLDLQFIRQPLVVNARRRFGFGDVHMEIEAVEKDLGDDGDDARAAWRAGDELSAPLRNTMAGVIEESGLLPPAGALAAPPKAHRH